jgi:hypothetical protein
MVVQSGRGKPAAASTFACKAVTSAAEIVCYVFVYHEREQGVKNAEGGGGESSAPSPTTTPTLITKQKVET